MRHQHRRRGVSGSQLQQQVTEPFARQLVEVSEGLVQQ